jgi:hypothetical protein
MSGFVGADADALDRVSVSVDQVVRRLDGPIRRLNGSIHGSPWSGRNADLFRRKWDSEYRHSIRLASEFLKEASTDLRRNAQQQRDASANGGSFGRGFCTLPGDDGKKGEKSWFERWLGGTDGLSDIFDIIDLGSGLKDVLEYAHLIGGATQHIPILGTLFNTFMIGWNIRDLIWDHPYEGAFGWIESGLDLVSIGASIAGVVGGIMLIPPFTPIGTAILVGGIAVGAVAKFADNTLEFWHKGGGRELWNSGVAPHIRQGWNNVRSVGSSTLTAVSNGASRVIESSVVAIAAPFRDAARGLAGIGRKVFSW